MEKINGILFGKFAWLHGRKAQCDNTNIGANGVSIVDTRIEKKKKKQVKKESNNFLVGITFLCNNMWVATFDNNNNQPWTKYIRMFLSLG